MYRAGTASGTALRGKSLAMPMIQKSKR